MKQYELKKVQIPSGETIAYRQAGHGKDVVVLVHGNMSSSVHFQTTMEKLEKDFTVYAVDLRGFGDSSYNKELNSLRDFALDIEAWAKLMKLDKFSVVGWSTGGGIVLEMAADMPDQIKKVLLLDSVGIKGYPMFKKGPDYQPILTQPITTKDEIKVDLVQVVPILMAYANKDKATLKAIWNAVIYNKVQPNEADYDLYLDAMIKQRNLVDVDYSLVHFNMTHEKSLVAEGSGRIDLIKCPVVIMHGQNDYVVPFAFALEMKAAFGDRAELITFEGVGHSCVTDDLELFVKTLKAHLN